MSDVDDFVFALALTIRDQRRNIDLLNIAVALREGE